MIPLNSGEVLVVVDANFVGVADVILVAAVPLEAALLFANFVLEFFSLICGEIIRKFPQASKHLLGY